MQYFIYLTRVDHKTFVPLQTQRKSRTRWRFLQIMTSAAIFLHCYHHQESPAAFLLDLGECAALGCPKAPQISNFSQLSDRCCPTAMADFHTLCKCL